MKDISVAGTIFLFLSVIGCASSPPRPKVVEDKKQELPIKSLKATSPEIIVRNDNKGLQLTVIANDSTIDLSETGIKVGNLKNVHGSISKKGKVISQFKGQNAVLDKEMQTLELSGVVTISGEDQGLVLKAERVLYDQLNEKITARQNVIIDTETLTLGPFPELISSPDFRQIATPGKYK